MEDNGATPHSFDRLSREQLEIYARELQQKFHEVRQLQQELEKEKQRLEGRLQELAALNRLFQNHVSQRLAADRANREVMEGLQRLTQEAATLAERARRTSADV